jgi:signal peptidase I
MADEHTRFPADAGFPARHRPAGERLAAGSPAGDSHDHRIAPGPAAGRSQPVSPPSRGTGKVTAPESKDGFREVVETVVFVVVLVLLLKSFLAEAFVIPTGSMATTLLGYHRNVTCPQCGHGFPVNASKEVDDQEGEPQPITGCTCPNCFFHIELRPRNTEGMLQP